MEFYFGIGRIYIHQEIRREGVLYPKISLM